MIATANIKSFKTLFFIIINVINAHLLCATVCRLASYEVPMCIFSLAVAELTKCAFHNGNSNVTNRGFLFSPSTSHLHCTAVGSSGHFWACVLGCIGGSDLLQYRWCSVQDTHHTASLQSLQSGGRTPVGIHPGTDPERGTWLHQTYLGRTMK